MFKRSLQTSLLVTTLAAAAMLTGCASVKTPLSKADSEIYQRNVKDAGVIYVQVQELHSGVEIGKESKSCDATPAGTDDDAKARLAKYCALLPESQVMRVIALSQKDGKIFTDFELAPKNVQVKVGSIVRLDTSKPKLYRFMDVAAYEPTPTCKWTGKDNQVGASGIEKFVDLNIKFMSGVLIVPGLILLAKDKDGGVECNGWSYKQVYREFLDR